jgi:phage regulator Rha-like protein
MTTNDIKSGVSVPVSIELTTTKTDHRVDSRLLAKSLGKKHRDLYELLKRYKGDFAELGILRFQTGVISGRGNPPKFALLNEDQAYLLLTYSRNNVKVRALKIKLITAFREARNAMTVRKDEYLPSYHDLHDAIKLKANGSPHEKFVHLNANKLLNKVAGISAGERPKAGLLQLSMMAVGAALAAKAVHRANDSKGLHQHIKTALLPLDGALSLEMEVCHVKGA